MTPELARKLFTYNKETGSLIWNDRGRDSFKSIKSYRIHQNTAGKEAGSLFTTRSNDYTQVHYNNKKYFAHRIAWAIHYGEIPNIINHLDGNGRNNAISNLENGTNHDNGINTRKNSCNTTGHTGVYRNKSKKKPWRVFIKVNGKMISRGAFETIDEAVVERAIAERQYGFSFRHGC